MLEVKWLEGRSNVELAVFLQHVLIALLRDFPYEERTKLIPYLPEINLSAYWRVLGTGNLILNESLDKMFNSEWDFYDQGEYDILYCGELAIVLTTELSPPLILSRDREVVDLPVPSWFAEVNKI